MRIAAGLVIACAAAFLPREARADDPPPNVEPAAAAADKPPPATPGDLPPLLFDPKLKLRLDLHGDLYLWFYQPLTQLEDPRPSEKPLGPDDRAFEIYVASLEISGKFDRFGVYVNPRFRDTKSREFFTSNVWLQQGYASFEIPHLKILAGKIENALSRIGDDSFYLNLLYFDGIKYETDYGLSVEGSFSGDSGPSFGYAAQYFVADGRTNGSLRDRETVWVDGAHRRNIGVVRVEPGYRFSPDASLRFGAAAEVFYVDLGAVSRGVVARLDADASLALGPVRVFAEGLAQIGQSVTAYPVAPTLTKPGRGSAHNYYGLAGAGVRIWRFYPRYSFSVARYADVGVTEMIHVPGVTFTAHDNVSLLLEYAYWPRRDPGRSWLLDSSLNLLIHGRF